MTSAAGRGRRFLDRTPQAAVLVGPDGTITATNGHLVDLMGYPEVALLGTDALSYLHPDDLPAVEVGLEDLLDNPVTRALEVNCRMRHCAGGWMHLICTGVDLREEPGFEAVLVTMRTAVEGDNPAARRGGWFEAVVSGTDDIVQVVDEDGRFLWASGPVDRLLGISAAAIVGLTIEQVGTADTPDRARAWFEHIHSRPGAHAPIVGTRTCVDGSTAHLEVRATNLLHDPEVRGVVLQTRDITEQVVLQQQRDRAEEANRLMAAAIESAGAAVVLTDTERRIISWNKEAERLSGQTAEEVLGHHLDGGDAPELEAVRRAAHERLRRGETFTYETERIRRDGVRLPLSVTTSLVVDDRGRHIGYSYICFDLTERQKAEAELEARARQASAVAELGQRALAGATLQDVLDDACELTSSTIAVPNVHVLLFSDDERHHDLIAAVGLFAPDVGRRDPVELRSWTTSIGTARRPVVVEDFETSDVERPVALQGTAARSGVVCAIDGREHPIGFFIAVDEVPRRWPEADVAFLQAIANVLATAVDRARVTAEMQRRALHDGLTNLPNRALLLDRLAQATARRERHDGIVALLFIDLDRFKRVNDTLGHRAGDEVLAATGRRLLAVVRGGDTVARTGGDEFLVLTEELADHEAAIALAERVAAALAQPIEVDGHSIHITASIGVAFAGAGSDPEGLVRDADLAMYRAKQEGRDRIQVFDASMRLEAMDRMAMEQALRAAVAGGAMKVVFQPQLRLDDGTVVGIEALARWAHPRRGPVPPAAFVELAEEIGLLDEITAAVLDASCAAAQAARKLMPGLAIAVNLTPQQLGRRPVLDLVRAALADHDLPADALIVEVTEAAALDDVAAMKVLAELRSIGVRASIDDFGTGYSSLARLTRVPVDEVKIDRSFVAGVAEDRGSAAVVGATVTIAGVLGLRLVAEGVETEEQRARLVELGCHEGQGWFLCGPMGERELLAWLADR